MCDCHRCTMEAVEREPFQPDGSEGVLGMIDPRTNRMFLCATCGNKRCPHAADHRNACTASNEPGQKGSLYEDASVPPAIPDKQEALAGEGVEGLREALEDAASEFDGIYHYTFESGTTAHIRKAAQQAEARIRAVLARTLPSNEALAGDDRNGVEGLVKRLRAMEPTGSFRLGGGQVACGDTSRAAAYGGEPVTKLRNPDGPEAADMIERLSRTPSSPQADEADVERAFRAGHAAGFDCADNTSRAAVNHVEDAWQEYRATMTARPAGGEEVERG